VNNLMQIGIAAKNYESSFESLPSGVVNPTGPIVDAPNGYHFNWITQLLPYMDARPVYRRLDFNADLYSLQNGTARAVMLNVLFCPSSPNPHRMAHTGQTEPIGGDPALTSYAACYNDTEAPIDVKNTGVFYLNSRTRNEDIEDGASNTIFFGEKAMEDTELGWASGTRSTLRNMGWTPNSKLRPIFPNSGPAAAAEDGAAAPPPGAVKAAKAGEDEKGPIVGGFASRHPGGANFGFGDGSVRFLKNTINPRIFQLLGNRADGDLLSADQF
jgi:prepilin-type processing-associated H-X9-DG protein